MEMEMHVRHLTQLELHKQEFLSTIVPGYQQPSSQGPKTNKKIQY